MNTPPETLSELRPLFKIAEGIAERAATERKERKEANGFFEKLSIN
jgi:hypothetical protein